MTQRLVPTIAIVDADSAPTLHELDANSMRTREQVEGDSVVRPQPTVVLAVKNWEEFQHYRDRDPVWIKLYGRLLDDAEFLALAEPAQAQLVKLWLVASRCRNQIRDDARFLKHCLHTNRLYVDDLVAAGFLERVASTPLAKPEQAASPHARPRARGEAEGETEAEKNKQKQVRKRTPPPDWVGLAIAQWAAKQGHLTATRVQRALASLVTKHGWEAVSKGMADYLTATPGEKAKLEWFAERGTYWVTLAAMPMTDPETCQPTERYRVTMRNAA